MGAIDIYDDPLNRAVDMGLALPSLKAFDEKGANDSNSLNISEEYTEEDHLEQDFLRAGRR